MAAIAQLKALLGMDNKQFKAKMRESTDASRSLQSSLKDIGRTLGAAFSVGAIISATKNLVSFASEIRHTADNLNVSTGSLQSLNAIALKYGMTVADLQKGLARLRQAQGKVIDGDKEYTDAVDVLNISLDEFANADTDKALELIAQGYAAAGGGAQAYSAVQDLMGRSAKKATAFMEELADKGLVRIQEEAKTAGDVIEDELITKLELLGTKNEQIMLKVKVGFAQLLGRIGTGASQLGTIAGSLFSQWEEKGGGTSIGGNIKAAIGVLRGGGIGKALDMAGQESASAGSASPTVQQRGIVKAVSDAIESQQPIKDVVEQAVAAQAMQSDARKLLTSRGAASAIGQGISPDALARVGGFVGPQRGGLGIADRQLKMQAELGRRAEERNKLLEDTVRRLEAIEENTSPPGVP